MFSRSIFFGVSIATIALAFPARSQTCIPLPVLGEQGSEVTKSVSRPTIPSPLGIDITRNNWNTDRAVPTDRPFDRFVATINAPGGGSFDIKMYWKYNDGTTGEFFNTAGARIEPGKPLETVRKRLLQPSETVIWKRFPDRGGSVIISADKTRKSCLDKRLTGFNILFTNGLLVIKAENRPGDEPYQINLFIGGVNYFGNTYTASVVGCYR